MTSRPDFKAETNLEFYKTPNPNWKPGQGANDDEWKSHKKIDFDPNGEDRNPVSNYRLLVSGVTPRPIAFISTISKDGVENLSPFSYFNMVNSNPIIFVVGVSKGLGTTKDTARNLLETGEATISLISEWFIEAANYTCTGAPSDVSEWDLSGLTKASSKKVKPAHVAESAMSFEVVVNQTVPFTSKQTGQESGMMFVLECVHIHVREDVINEDKTQIDLAKLKPVARCGGNIYTRTTEAFELVRPYYKEEIEKPEVAELIKK